MTWHVFAGCSEIFVDSGRPDRRFSTTDQNEQIAKMVRDSIEREPTHDASA